MYITVPQSCHVSSTTICCYWLSRWFGKFQSSCTSLSLSLAMSHQQPCCYWLSRWFGKFWSSCTSLYLSLAMSHQQPHVAVGSVDGLVSFSHHAHHCPLVLPCLINSHVAIGSADGLVSFSHHVHHCTLVLPCLINNHMLLLAQQMAW